MTDPERRFTLDDYLHEAQLEGTFDSMLVGKSLREIHRSGKYRTMFVPEIQPPVPARTINAVQMAAFFPNGEMGLFESFPGGREPEAQETLRRILAEQTDIFDNILEIENLQIIGAVDALKAQNLGVAGAFQLGTLEDGMRSVEIIYPLAFYKITRSPTHAAALSASFIRALI